MHTDTSTSPFVRLRSTDIADARWTGGFWAERLAVCHRSMLPTMWQVWQDPQISHGYTNLRIAAGLEQGEHRGPKWHDGDLFKWLEGVAYVYTVTHDESLARLMDEVIAVADQAQRADGYLHTPVLIKQRQQSGEARPFQDPDDFETYNMGHLMTTACVHYRATGQRALLDIARKAGDYLGAVYRQSPKTLARNAICPSHYMGLVEMYRTTGEARYLDLARLLIDSRDLVDGGTDQNQDRLPFRQQTQAVGHAVRANYLYAGVADVYAETGEEALLRPLELLWEDVVSRKLYVTGATGALYDGASPDGSQRHAEIQLVHQAYGRPYQLPNITAYNESCATIGLALWGWRMLAITGRAQIADTLERVLYNGILATISLDGKAFFYRNTLCQVSDLPFALRWSPRREPYISCFCCPPNTVRSIAAAATYAYGLSAGAVWVNLYGSNVLDTTLPDGPRLRLIQETDYPWDGRIRITLDRPPQGDLALLLRIPAWAVGATVQINGQTPSLAVRPGSYLELRRTWSAGDVIELDLPLEVQLLQAHPLVEEARNQVAIQRGPLVYCLESADLPPGVGVADVLVPRDIALRPRFDAGLLDGVTVLEGQAEVLPSAAPGELYRPVPRQAPQKALARLIPYYAWGNRGPSEMAVWLPIDW